MYMYMYVHVYVRIHAYKVSQLSALTDGSYVGAQVVVYDSATSLEVWQLFLIIIITPIAGPSLWA